MMSGPPPPGQFRNLVEIAGLGVIQDIRRAMFGHQRQAPFAARRADNCQAQGRGDLQGGDTHGARGPMPHAPA